MVLLQAGLGRRTLNIPENADFSQISYILMESYSKMVPLEGAWMLHKAAGGSGQRKLSVLAPEAEGYTGAYLAKALGGKGCLYIMPIQDTLDTSPLPYSSKEFENMPKARCATCHLSMPVQLLALHAQESEPSSCSDRMDLEPDLDPDLESPATSNPGNASPSVLPCRTSCSKIDIKVACPFTLQSTQIIDLEEHASEELTGREKSLAEAIETLSGRVDTTTLFNPDAEFLMGAISPVFSELGSLRCQRESRIVNFLQDFIQNIEDEEEEKSFVVEERGTPVKITTESDLDDGDSRETESTGEPARDEEEMKEKHKITAYGAGHVPITSTESDGVQLYYLSDKAPRLISGVPEHYNTGCYE
ncbi:hypothetical protein NQZ68_000009 [Dissostichus eleginoides]|nr:hypothetical protein NQZ68_000009 [Dissostichus eleginoides]